jgi:hypothetical protein
VNTSPDSKFNFSVFPDRLEGIVDDAIVLHRRQRAGGVNHGAAGLDAL